MALAKLLCLGGLLSVSVAQTPQYVLQDSYDVGNFFNEFQFLDTPDLAGGDVTYVNAETANRQGLAGFTGNSVYLGVDFNTTNPPNVNRNSTRVFSTKTYTHGLFIADIAHMPEGCGTWPALWTYGPDWPNSGEIDIIEGVNSRTADRITLHTGSTCNVANAGSASSTELLTENCNLESGQEGCSQATNASTALYGTAFNAGGGGIYAMEWTSDFIAVWFFPRSSQTASAIAASGAKGSAPDQTSWPAPAAKFVPNGCNFDEQFYNHTLTINTDICGLASLSDGDPNTWDNDPVCSKLGSSCSEYAAANPEAFTNAYWLINSIKVYQQSASTKRQAKQFVA